jgi:hypothetical protein
MSAILHRHVQYSNPGLDRGLNEKTPHLKKVNKTQIGLVPGKFNADYDCTRSSPGHKSNPKPTNTLPEAIGYRTVMWHSRFATLLNMECCVGIRAVNPGS